ncbi:ATP-binding protein [Variovorax sp. PCZ-1]|uniref:ATP-binding protein n=1 Tax=Variovorax sp. PCZ-1 TaxID=2835533 RepID=UPI001BCB5DB2|nr:ATP-binding protein [Variovorax sp. PCZ-1]MBS7806388.1 PAS domain-containing protein [Variovorax sp. PCZ-1]
MQEATSRFSALLDSSAVASPELDLSDRESGMPRLWRGFMAARILVAGVLLLLLLYLRVMGQPPQIAALLICIAYLVLTVWVRVLGRPTLPGARFDPQWVITIGVDVLVFGLLLYMQVGSINFAPLFALPVLLAAVLGPLLLALGTAATVTVVVLLDALQYTFAGSTDAAGRYVQASITGIGLFVVAYLANQLATRLVRQERVALGSEMAARAQIQVNQLVIDNLNDGVMVIDANGVVHAANPSAREMLGDAAISNAQLAKPPFVLASRPAWQSVADVAVHSFLEQQGLERDVVISHGQGASIRLRVKTSLSSVPHTSSQGSLCVMFMEDLREMEARVRTEKLAAMGRMSAAVAHEIRNPLSAISQANELLAEEMQSPQQKKLVRMVAQNVQRLNRVVEDVLDVSRAQGGTQSASTLHDASRFIKGVCDDWQEQNKARNILVTGIEYAQSAIEFEADHLRRVLVNLLDNALRHATQQAASIQVSFSAGEHFGVWVLSVWSDGTPIEQGVQRHLFEPFFSSQSRSSGLGLYICRELCMRHGATIAYQRSMREIFGQLGRREGNDFVVQLRAGLESTQPMGFMTSQSSSMSRF